MTLDRKITLRGCLRLRGALTRPEDSDAHIMDTMFRVVGFRWHSKYPVYARHPPVRNRKEIKWNQ